MPQPRGWKQAPAACAGRRSGACSVQMKRRQDGVDAELSMAAMGVPRRGRQGPEGEGTRQLCSLAATASGASPFRILAEKKSNEGGD